MVKFMKDVRQDAERQIYLYISIALYFYKANSCVNLYDEKETKIWESRIHMRIMKSFF